MQAPSPLGLLVETGLLLARERSLDVIAQSAVDAGVQLCGAPFGAFFYRKDGAHRASPACKVSGAGFQGLGSPPQLQLNGFSRATFEAGEAVRLGDLARESRHGREAPFRGMPAGPPIRSYLAIPARSGTGQVLGGMFYGHPDPDAFSEEQQKLATTIAAQAAAAIDTAHLAETLKAEIDRADAARKEQRQTAERLQAVLESTTDAVFLLDRNWRFTFLNQRAVELIAGGRDLTGKLVWKAFPEAIRTTFYDRFAEVMSGSRCTEFTEPYAPLHRWFFVRAYPTAEGIAVFFQDVTAAHETANERDKTERRLRSALEAGQLGTWDWDANTDLMDLDERAAALYGVEPHTPVSRSRLRESLVIPEDLQETPVTLRETIADGGTYRAEYRIERDGRQRWVAAHGVATFDESRMAVLGMVGTVQDVTERKTQEAMLRETEKLAATGRLAASIAHEINNPLEAVTNLIFLAKTDETVPGPARRLLEMADGELARVGQIAQQTLGFYRDTTRPGTIDLNTMLKEICDLFSRKMMSRRLSCRTEVEPELRIFGLGGEIRQVFSNLMVNAIEASNGGEITIRAQRRRCNGCQGVSCLIADHGTGIPPAVRQRLFTPFTTSKQSLGTGLGLWVTRGIVEKHGGRISVHTRTEPPTGTVFRVFLPSDGKKSDSPRSAQIQQNPVD